MHRLYLLNKLEVLRCVVVHSTDVVQCK